MSMKLANLEVTLPPAVVQHVPHAKRVVTISGSQADGSQDVAISFAGPIQVRAAVDAEVTIGIQEVLSNGKTHTPVVIKFTPAALVEPIPPDAGQFVVKLISIEDGPEPAAPPEPSDQATRATPDPAAAAVDPAAAGAGDLAAVAINPDTGRVIPNL